MIDQLKNYWSNHQEYYQTKNKAKKSILDHEYTQYLKTLDKRLLREHLHHFQYIRISGDISKWGGSMIAIKALTAEITQYPDITLSNGLPLIGIGLFSMAVLVRGAVTAARSRRSISLVQSEIMGRNQDTDSVIQGKKI